MLLKEITELDSQIVCMMMPFFTMSVNNLSVLRDYNTQAMSFDSKMTLVSGPTGCWISHKVFPTLEYQRVTANTLKNEIKLLTLDHIGNEL